MLVKKFNLFTSYILYVFLFYVFSSFLHISEKVIKLISFSVFFIVLHCVLLLCFTLCITFYTNNVIVVAVQCNSEYVEHDGTKTIRAKTAVEDRPTLFYDASQTSDSAFPVETIVQ